MSSSKLELNDICKKFIKLADTINDNEKRFLFLSGIVHLAENYLDDQLKSTFVKELAHFIATIFGRYENLNSSKEMLQIWAFVGKYSKSLGMDGVLKKLDELGHFKKMPDFYIMWCEFLGESGKEAEFNDVVKKCKEHGIWNTFMHQEVNRLRVRFFSCEDDRTDLLFQNLQSNASDPKILLDNGNSDNVFIDDKENKKQEMLSLSAKKSDNRQIDRPTLIELHTNRRISEFPASELSRVSEESDEVENSLNSKHSDPSAKSATEILKASSSNKSETLWKSSFDNVGNARNLNSATGISEQKSNNGMLDFVAGTSFSTNLYRNVVDAFANTLPLSQEAPMVVEETQHSETSVDFNPPHPVNIQVPAFEIFRDNGNQQDDKIPKPVLKVRQSEAVKAASDSPLAKKLRSNFGLEPKPDVSYNDEDIISSIAFDSKQVRNSELCIGSIKDDAFKKPTVGKIYQQTIGRNSPTETIMLRDDDMTIAGTHKSNLPINIEHATSTPQKSNVPPLFEDLTKNLALEKNKQLEFEMETDENFFITNTATEKAKFFDKANDADPVSEFQRRLSITMNPAKALETKLSDSHVSKSSDGSVKKLGHETITNELALDMRRLSLVGKLAEFDVDFNETTGTGLIKETIVGDLNPWDERKRAEILSKISSSVFVERHDFPKEKCPRFDVNGTINLGGEKFEIKQIIGRGGFATVYKCYNENKLPTAIKHQAPPCPWEFYICKTLQLRLPPRMLDFVMQVQDIYIFSNASAIVYDFYKHGTLLDLSNNYKKESAEMSGAVLGIIGLQMAKTLQYVHDSTIIHGDIKPDNFIFRITIDVPSNQSEWDLFLNRPIIKLIDWGRSIDMRHFPGKEFRGRAGTESFDCVEMTKNLPWTYQTDYYGYVCTIYVLIHQDYMKTQLVQGKFRPLKNIKRRMLLRSAWEAIFDEFLNIPNCCSQPSWVKAIAELERQLKYAVSMDIIAWKKAIERFNSFLPNN